MWIDFGEYLERKIGRNFEPTDGRIPNLEYPDDPDSGSEEIVPTVIDGRRARFVWNDFCGAWDVEIEVEEGA